MPIDKINPMEKFSRFDDHWSPKIIAELNDAHIKLVKLQGEFVWHHHDNEDEMFYVIKGQLLMKLEDRDVLLNEGDMIVIPKGIEHMPVAPDEVWIMLIEPKTTLNTGNIENERTAEAQWI